MERIEIELEDHTKELEQAINILSKVEKDYKWYRDSSSVIPISKKQVLVYMTATVLDLVGELSMTRFDVRETMEQEYHTKFPQSPELGKKLYLDHYENLHKPYDKIKNKCFDLLSKIDPKCEIEIN